MLTAKSFNLSTKCMTPIPTQTSTPLIKSSKLKEGQSKGFIVGGTNLFIVRHQGKVVAYLNSCPHRKIPLQCLPNQFLDFDKQFIRCSNHAALFTIEHGLCISGPCNHQSLTRVKVEEYDDQIYCTIPPA
jgi:nitrite reductase/ring-hydroxylating ferredoxin subunit